MRSSRTPNQLLRTLLDQAGWSGARLAREVNALAAEHRLHLSYDRSSVGHWLAGTRPRPPAPELVAEALTRRLGRPVPLGETGLTAASGLAGGPVGGTDAATWAEGAAVNSLEYFGSVSGRLSVGRGGVFSLAALEVPGWDGWRPVSAGIPGEGDARLRHVARPPDVASARTLLEVFSRHEAAFGGGQIRDALRLYLATTVAGWLRQPRTPPTVRRELLTVAGQLTYLCAFVHYDSGLPALAQRYYFAGLALSREGGDRIGYGLGARGLSVLALSLGHRRHADRLAQLAVHVGLPQAPPHQRSFLLGQLAVARAHVNDQRDAAAHLVHAERMLERAESGATPVGAFHPGSLGYQRAAIARARGDHRREVVHLQFSLVHRPHGELRSRAISTAALAEAQLDLGHLDAACRTWLSFLAAYPQVDSARAHDRLRTCLARLRPHTAHRGAAMVHDRARELHIRLART